MAKAHSSPPSKPPDPGESGETPPVEPLTRGTYKRLAKTEQQIMDAAALAPAALIARARCRNEDAPEFLPAEALVYFIRRSVLSGDTRTRDALFRELIERCMPYFRGQFRGFDRETREDLQNDVMKKVVEDLFAADDRGDFMQVRFWKYLDNKTIDACRKAFRHSGDTESLDTGISGESGSEGQTRLEQEADDRLSPEQLTMISEGLAKLPERLRAVFLLRHYVGMKIGADNAADDPEGELTIAQRYGCSGRTIRNWLKEAEGLLAGFREKKNGE
ncbi:MAG: sigma-70 family RNA polymerase sigma factor [Hyphomicrobiales bacterium]|nr:sigma-70 family RNA polymerase sigma factor [Hyphomicrobiales bacterium]MCP5372063.1 sigma-70 family RNA polymerase sigma factor [Hyphomicrobiales bacterium]